jgi:hypothetical protein
MPKRWNRLRAFAWGASIGALGGCLAETGSWRFDQVAVLAGQIGEVTAGAIAGGLIFGLAVVARDRAWKL